MTESDMWLVYADQHGNKHHQHYTEIATSGTLVDPETGDDMELIGWTQEEPEWQ